MVALTHEDIPGELPWVYKFFHHFIDVYEALCREITPIVVALDRNRLEEFVCIYTQTYDDLKIGIPSGSPDRHKIIALLTRAFLNALPFRPDLEKIDKLYNNGADIPRALRFPNEYFAMDICMKLLNGYGRHMRRIENYKFCFPSKINLWTHGNAQSEYRDELFLLYRHYINRRAAGVGNFSIHQMAHVYFLLEMGCDIANYDMRLDYYN